MPLANTLVSWFVRQRLDNFYLGIEHPWVFQEKLLKNLLNSARHTEFGKAHDFSSIKNYEEFAARVPLQDYETLKPHIQRMIQGEQNILWSGDIGWFAKSSGTTSDRSKFIPVSREGLSDCHFKAGRDLMAVYCSNHPDTKIFSGKSLVMGGSHRESDGNSECRVGDISAVMVQNMPLLAHWTKTPELSIALMDDWEQKLQKMVEVTRSENVTSLAGVPTWVLVLLKNILEETGKENICEVWPNLELYIHGGVSFKPYRQQFQNLIPSEKMRYYETYNASEGFFAFADAADADDMLLLPDNGVFYEFMSDGKVIPLAEVEAGKTYALIISTNSGLWRYQIGDTVRFTHVNPHRVQVAGRVKHFINAFGEEVIVDNSDRAIKEACEATGALVVDYTAAPIFFEGNKKGGHEWLIEFEKAPVDLNLFTHTLDAALRKINSDYDAKRFKDIALQLPVVHALPQNTFYNWMKSKNKIGGQNKVPRLSNERKYVEEILKSPL